MLYLFYGFYGVEEGRLGGGGGGGGGGGEEIT